MVKVLNMSREERAIATAALQAALLGCTQLQAAIDADNAPEVGDCISTLAADASASCERYWEAIPADEEKKRDRSREP